MDAPVTDNRKTTDQCALKRKAAFINCGDDGQHGFRQCSRIRNNEKPKVNIPDLVDSIYDTLSHCEPNDAIFSCGRSPMLIIKELPDDVLALAHSKLHALPFGEVPLCWRRLYEEATLYKAAQILLKRGQHETALNCGTFSNLEETETWSDDLIKILDSGLSLSGAPQRTELFNMLFEQLEQILPEVRLNGLPDSFDAGCPSVLQTQSAIARVDKPLDFVAFQGHLDTKTTPVIIPGIVTEWPAFNHWKHPSYLLQHTLGGRRLVPVELGKSYVDDGWGQQIMSMRHFMEKYLIPPSCSSIGYLAQHDLLTQIPALKNDIRIPDYCYTTPPTADVHAARTAGLSTVATLDEPLLNAWLGPAGTKTPLHTDPYHNILAQVVGYKYVRLYPPRETQKLYPLGVDEAGISFENTSSVDIGLIRPDVKYADDPTREDMLAEKEGADTHIKLAERELHDRFPLFKEAEFREAILGPGECLYIPLGWWHYVESLSTSFSVSFWWN